MTRRSILMAGLAGVCLAPPWVALAQTAFVSPNTIHGTVAFTNTNPDVLAILASQGMSQVTVAVSSSIPVGITARSGEVPSTTELLGSYALLAESHGGGVPDQVEYNGSAQATVYQGGPAHGPGATGSGWYNFRSKPVTLAPVAAAPDGADLDFAEMVTVHRIRFGTDDTCTTPAAIGGGEISGYPYGSVSLFGVSVAYFLTPNYPDLGPGLPAIVGTLTAIVGSDPFADTLKIVQAIDLGAAGDTVVDHCIGLPHTSGISGPGLGRIDTPLSIDGHTIMSGGLALAYSSPNARYAHADGAGLLSFVNLLPGPYWISLQSVRLDSGPGESEVTSDDYWMAPAVQTSIPVAGGASTDGAETFGGASFEPFLMHPAHHTGSIRLYDAYARTHPGALSTLESLYFAIDGYPTRSPYGPSHGTHVRIGGRFSQASGHDSSNFTSFAGRYVAGSGELASTYSIPMVLVYDQPAAWSTRSGMKLFFASTVSSYYFNYDTVQYLQRPEGADPVTFRYGFLDFTSTSDALQSIGPGATASSDHHYCFNEIDVQIVSTGAAFINPSVSTFGGFNSATELDFEGHSPSYYANGGFTGTPCVGTLLDPAVRLAARATSGHVRFTLPQGNFTIVPLVTFVDDVGATTNASFAWITLDHLGCGQHVTVTPGQSLTFPPDPGLAVSVDPQTECFWWRQSQNGDEYPGSISGSFSAGGTAPERAWYTINDGPEMEICGGATGLVCGPTYSTPVVLGYGSNTIAVHASASSVPSIPAGSLTIECNAFNCGGDALCYANCPSTEAICAGGCGYAWDSVCMRQVNCGQSCPQGQSCGGGGVVNACGAEPHDPCAAANGGCAQECTPSSQGEARCSCRAGYVLGADGLSCTVVDACATHNGGCDPLTVCVDDGSGTARCGACPQGYTGTGTTGCRENVAPVIVLEPPLANGGQGIVYTGEPTLVVAGMVSEDTAVAGAVIIVNGEPRPVELGAGGNFQVIVQLTPGENQITVAAVDTSANTAEQAILVVLGPTPPTATNIPTPSPTDTATATGTATSPPTSTATDTPTTIATDTPTAIATTTLPAGCSDVVQPGCLSAQKALLILKQNGGANDKQLFKWVNGAALTQLQLGDPTGATQYRVCVYSGPTDAFLESFSIPAGAPNWSPISHKGYKYKELNGTNGGITNVLLKGNATAPKSKVLVKGKGVTLPDPTLVNLPLPVTVQVVNPDTNVCVEAVFDANDVKNNTDTIFKAQDKQ